jgi:hypothetical protein
MKKILTITCLALSAMLILDSMNVWHALFMFYLAGEIPGTKSSVSPTIMLQAFALMTGFVFARLGNSAVLVLKNYLDARRTQTHKKFAA